MEKSVLSAICASVMNFLFGWLGYRTWTAKKAVSKCKTASEARNLYLKMNLKPEMEIMMIIREKWVDLADSEAVLDFERGMTRSEALEAYKNDPSGSTAERIHRSIYNHSVRVAASGC